MPPQIRLMFSRKARFCKFNCSLFLVLIQKIAHGAIEDRLRYFYRKIFGVERF